MVRFGFKGPGAGLGPQEAAEAASEGALLVDVRHAREWDAGHAPGAVNVPLDALSGRLSELRQDRRIVVVCRSGQRSASATEQLLRSGIDAVNLDGGLLAWVEAGLAIESDDGGPGYVA